MVLRHSQSSPLEQMAKGGAPMPSGPNSQGSGPSSPALSRRPSMKARSTAAGSSSSADSAAAAAAGRGMLQSAGQRQVATALGESQEDLGVPHQGKLLNFMRLDLAHLAVPAPLSGDASARSGCASPSARSRSPTREASRLMLAASLSRDPSQARLVPSPPTSSYEMRPGTSLAASRSVTMLSLPPQPARPSTTAADGTGDSGLAGVMAGFGHTNQSDFNSSRSRQGSSLNLADPGASSATARRVLASDPWAAAIEDAAVNHNVMVGAGGAASGRGASGPRSQLGGRQGSPGWPGSFNSSMSGSGSMRSASNALPGRRLHELLAAANEEQARISRSKSENDKKAVLKGAALRTTAMQGIQRAETMLERLKEGKDLDSRPGSRQDDRPAGHQQHVSASGAPHDAAATGTNRSSSQQVPGGSQNVMGALLKSAKSRRWGKLNAAVDQLDGDVRGAQFGVMAFIKEMQHSDEFSLVEAARRRMQAFESIKRPQGGHPKSAAPRVIQVPRRRVSSGRRHNQHLHAHWDTQQHRPSTTPAISSTAADSVPAASEAGQPQDASPAPQQPPSLVVDSSSAAAGAMSGLLSSVLARRAAGAKGPFQIPAPTTPQPTATQPAPDITTPPAATGSSDPAASPAASQPNSQPNTSTEGAQQPVQPPGQDPLATGFVNNDELVTLTLEPVDEGATFTGVFGRSAELRERMDKQRRGLVAQNPVAFQEESAAQAEAEYRTCAERAKLKYNETVKPGASTDAKPLVEFFSAVKTLNASRPFFLPPVTQRDKVVRPKISEKGQVMAEAPVWSLPTSIFAGRVKECEGRDFYDTEKVKVAQFNLDWPRVAGKARFRKLVGREDKAVKASSERLEEELGEVREECFKHKDQLRFMFNYYSMTGGDVSNDCVFSMTFNQWMHFVNEAGIVDGSGARGCLPADLQTVFIAVNFEEESGTAEADANDDDAMMRFEFLEGIVRSAFGRFITTKKCDDASDAVQMLIEQVLLRNVPPEALVDPNDFRRHRMYNEEMDLALREHWDMVQAMFKLYKAKDRSKFMFLEHWAAFCDASGLLGTHTGIERREIKLIFGWSQLIVTDELKRRRRAMSLTLFDFVEALCRMADLLSPPSPEEVDKYFTEVQGVDPKRISGHRLVEYYKVVGPEGSDRKRESAELVAPPTRPLVLKFHAMMELVVAAMRGAWGGRDEKECAAKMMKMATMISGGIEMA